MGTSQWWHLESKALPGAPASGSPSTYWPLYWAEQDRHQAAGSAKGCRRWVEGKGCSTRTGLSWRVCVSPGRLEKSS